LEIFDISHNNSQGGSFRIFAKKVGNSKYAIQPSVQKFIDMENSAKLYEDSTYDNFVSNCITMFGELKNLISKLLDKKHSISCYGCSAKFALLSKLLGFNNKNIQYVVDDSPLKQGMFTPGNKIPIVNSTYFKENPTDYSIITAWNLARPIIERNSWYNGRFIIPLPKPIIVE